MIRIFIFIIIFSFHNIYALNLPQQNENNFGFIENKGQVLDQNANPNNSVLYLLKTPGLNIQIKANGFSYETYNVNKKLKPNKTLIEGILTKENELENSNNYDYSFDFHRVEIAFENAVLNPKIIATNASNDYINHYNIAGYEKGFTGIRSFEKVTLQEVYPNIDIEFVFNKKDGFKYNLIVKPGADLSKVKFKYIGAPIALKKNQITIETINGNINENIPKSWFASMPESLVKVNYVLLNENTIGFFVNKQIIETLIIDPIGTRIWGTYYGGSSNEYGYATTTDSSNNVFLSGYTLSNNFMTTTGAYQTTIAGSWDAFVVKFNSAGVRQWATYFGGSSADLSTNCIADPFGNIILTGYTQSTSNIATSGAHQQSYSSSWDGFLVKFNNAGVRQWGTYYGGVGSDQPFGLGVDQNGNLYVSGVTGSNSAISTSGAHQPNITGGTDAFLVKFNNAGTIQWGTYYGGTGNDLSYDCAVTPSGLVALCGNTQSLNNIVTAGAHQTVYGASQDAFLALFNTNGIRQWGTYYGGSSNDIGNSCSFDGYTNIYLAGTTQSYNNIGTTGSHQPSIALGLEGFLAKFNVSGTLQWGTYYGGALADYGNDCFGTETGEVFLTGTTQSDTGVATVGVQQATYKGNGDAFLAKFNEFGIRQWGTYFGDLGAENSRSIVTDKLGKVYISGETNSNFGISSSGSHQPIYIALYDAFLAKFEGCSILETPDTIYGNILICDSSLQTYQVNNSNGASGYYWEIPLGWQLIAGQGTKKIEVKANQNNGVIKVKALNTCSDTSNYFAKNVNIIQLIDSLGSIVGANQVCKNALIFFSVYALPNATTYNWKLPNGWQITSGLGTNNIQLLTNNDTGTISVQAINFCGDSSNVSSLSITFPLPASKPANISGNAKVCANNNYTYTVQSVPNVSGYLWKLPAGWVINSGQYSTSINVTAANISGNISVKTYNNCGDSSTDLLFLVEPYPTAASTDSIKGNSYICSGTYQTYYVDSIPNATVYQWTLPQDWFLVSGQNSRSISVVTSYHAGDVTVTPYNQCGIASSTITKYVSIAPQSSQPGLILGSTNICNNTNQTYTVGASTNAMGYIWTLPEGWTFNSGQGTTVINVKSSNTSGDISVKSYNLCSDSSLATTLAINVTAKPFLTGPINGPSAMCENDTKEFVIAPNTSASYYRWKIPIGWQIVTGDSTNDITLLCNNTAGNISVSCINSCGDSSNTINKAITIEFVPTIPGDILGPTVVNSLSDISYVVNQVLGLTYNWAIPNGWVIMSGQGTNVLLVRTGTQDGNISVTASNNCGTSTEKTLAVNVATTGIENRFIEKLNLFPNPIKAGNKITLKLEPNHFVASNYSILDIAGRELINESLNNPNSFNEVDLNTNNLNAGSYMLILKSKKQELISIPFIVY